MRITLIVNTPGEALTPKDIVKALRGALVTAIASRRIYREFGDRRIPDSERYKRRAIYDQVERDVSVEVVT